MKKGTLRRLALLFSLILLLTSTINSTFCLIVTQTDSIINTFTPLVTVINRLLINKEVEHPFGQDYVIPDHISFNFKVDFGEDYANTVIQTSGGRLTADKDGAIYVCVKPKKAFSVEGIEVGTKVTVTEVQNEGSGFAVKNDVATMEGVVAVDGRLSFSYVNVYSPAPAKADNVTITGTKVLKGREWQKGDTFSFLLEQKLDEDTWISLGTKSVTYDEDDEFFDEFEFTDLLQAISFDEVGTYLFRMTEVIGDLDRVDYDKSVNTFSIKVTDKDMDGKLEVGDVTADQHASVKKTDGNYAVSVTFNNKYIPAIPDPDDITVKIKIDKKVKNTGTVEIGPEGFEFLLENVETGEKKRCISNIEGDAEILLTFAAKDIGKEFQYKLSERNSGILGVTYDSKVYDISVAIAKDTSENLLIPTIKMDGKVVQKAEAAFENIYHNMVPVPDDTFVDIEVKKIVKNTSEVKIGPEGFNFVLENKDTAERILLTSNDNGKVNYRLPFTAADSGKIFTYTLCELNEGVFGMTYDDRVYEISVEVTLSQENTLVTSVTVNGKKTDRVVTEFENIYHVEKPVNPTTSDRSNLTLWIVLAVVSGTTFIILLLIEIKKRKEEKEEPVPITFE